MKEGEKMRKKMLKFLRILYCIAIVMSIMSCAPIQQKEKKIEETRILAEDYEKERQFKEALQKWKALLELEPDNQKIQARVKQMTADLAIAIQKHLGLGKTYFQQRNWERARKELLLTLFLDPEQQEALRYIRKIYIMSPAWAMEDIEIRYPDIKGGKYFIHILQKGESLSILAKKYYGNVMEYPTIAYFNNITDINQVSVGQKIKIPIIEGKKILKDDKKVKITPPQVVKPVPEERVEKKVVKKDEEIKEEDAPILEDYQQIAKLDEKSLEEIFDKAMELFKEDKFSEAIDKFQEVIKLYPDHPPTMKYLKISKEITSHLNKGTELNFARKYGMAFDEFSKILTLKPNSTIANDKIDNLLSPMITEARFVFYDEQSPCEAISLLKKVLQRDPKNKDAKALFQEATILAEGLNLECK
jgi:tetratricopeptide (TPR) repeat protein